MSIWAQALGGGADALLKQREMERKAEIDDELIQKRSTAETQRALAVEAYKQNAATARRTAALGGSPTGAMPATSGATSTGGAAPGDAPVDQGGGGIDVPGVGNVNSTNVLAVAKKFGIPEEAIRYKLADDDYKGIGELIATAARPDVLVVGNQLVDKKTNKPIAFIPMVSQSSTGAVTVTSQEPDGTFSTAIPKGAIDASAAYTRSQGMAGAESKVREGYDTKTGRPILTTEKNVIDAANGKTPTGPNVIPPAQQADRDAESLQIMQGELQKANQDMMEAQARGDGKAAAMHKDTVAALERDIAKREKQIPGGVTAPAGPIAAGPSMTEKAAQEALVGSNAEFNKNSYPKAIATGQRAQTVLDSITGARQGMQRMDGTGWGKETRLNAQKILEGIGLSTKDSRNAVLGMQQFQNAAMGRLQVVLNDAAGPQTEGDADRASQTFARIGNTTAANEFILDAAQATAERDKMKAMFYATAAPLARKSPDGDLSAVDRKWLEMEPSIYSFPVMQRWNKK